jgi:hypothetical protein
MTPINVLLVICLASLLTWLAASLTWRRGAARNSSVVLIASLVMLAAVLSPAVALACLAGLFVAFLIRPIPSGHGGQKTAVQARDD